MQATPEPTTFRFRHSEALLRSVLENAAVATFLVGPDGRLLYANRAFRSLLGYSEDDPFTAVVDDLIHPEDLPSADSHMGTLRERAAEGYRAERRYLKKNGEPIWVLVSASALRDDETGDLHYTIVQAINIDKQKRAEAALAESENRWNFALESAGQGVWDHDLNNRTAFYSRMWRLMRGMDPDETVAPTIDEWLERVHPDDRPRIRDRVELQNSGGVPEASNSNIASAIATGTGSGSSAAASRSPGIPTAAPRVSWAPTPISPSSSRSNRSLPWKRNG